MKKFVIKLHMLWSADKNIFCNHDHIFYKESEIVNLVEKITKSQIRTDLPNFQVGDTIKVDLKIVEGKTHRIQAFEGVVMAIQGSGVSKNFIVR